MRAYFLIMLMAFFLVGCSHHYPQAPRVLSPIEATYQLQQNDIVTIRVYEEPELTGQYMIDSQGKVALPLIGKTNLLHQTEQRAAIIIQNRLQQGGFLQKPKVSVEVFKARPFFVMGEVEKPGSFAFQSGLTVFQAVALSGGYTYRADRKDITIRRQSGKGAGTEIYYAAQEDTPVLPGDAIEIGERYF